MKNSDLYKKMLEIVPVKSDESKDFRDLVKDNLKSFYHLLQDLDIQDQPPLWDKTIKRVKQLCDGINRAIEKEYQGLRHSAYSAVKNQLEGYVKGGIVVDRLIIEKNLLTIPSSDVSYRMRKVELEEQQKLKRKDMFHIPLDKKGLVQTQRFSVPGYPCLYLSKSIYGCWEEMGRPNYGTVMVSRFKSQKSFNVLDFRIPSKDLWDQDLTKCILFFPIVIASMVQVKNNKDNYKPEYLVPQLLTEWIIYHNRKEKDLNKKIIGILYTSAQKNKDFNFPDYSYDNYAIPVLTPLTSKKHCSDLKDIFYLSLPTYYDLEVLKHGDRIDSVKLGLDDEENKKENLRISHFGKMENFISTAELDVVED